MAVIAFEAHDDDREIVGGAGSEHVLPRLLDQRLGYRVLRDECAPSGVSQDVVNAVAAPPVAD